MDSITLKKAHRLTVLRDDSLTFNVSLPTQFVEQLHNSTNNHFAAPKRVSEPQPSAMAAAAPIPDSWEDAVLPEVSPSRNGVADRPVESTSGNSLPDSLSGLSEEATSSEIDTQLIVDARASAVEQTPTQPAAPFDFETPVEEAQDDDDSNRKDARAGDDDDDDGDYDDERDDDCDEGGAYAEQPVRQPMHALGKCSNVAASDGSGRDVRTLFKEAQGILAQIESVASQLGVQGVAGDGPIGLGLVDLLRDAGINPATGNDFAMDGGGEGVRFGDDDNDDEIGNPFASSSSLASGPIGIRRDRQQSNSINNSSGSADVSIMAAVNRMRQQLEAVRPPASSFLDDDGEAENDESAEDDNDIAAESSASVPLILLDVTAFARSIGELQEASSNRVLSTGRGAAGPELSTSKAASLVRQVWAVLTGTEPCEPPPPPIEAQEQPSSSSFSSQTSSSLPFSLAALYGGYNTSYTPDVGSYDSGWQTAGGNSNHRNSIAGDSGTGFGAPGSLLGRFRNNDDANNNRSNNIANTSKRSESLATDLSLIPTGDWEGSAADNGGAAAGPCTHLHPGQAVLLTHNAENRSSSVYAPSRSSSSTRNSKDNMQMRRVHLAEPLAAEAKGKTRSRGPLLSFPGAKDGPDVDSGPIAQRHRLDVPLSHWSAASDSLLSSGYAWHTSSETAEEDARAVVAAAAAAAPSPAVAAASVGRRGMPSASTIASTAASPPLLALLPYPSHLSGVPVSRLWAQICGSGIGDSDHNSDGAEQASAGAAALWSLRQALADCHRDIGWKAQAAGLVTSLAQTYAKARAKRELARSAASAAATLGNGPTSVVQQDSDDGDEGSASKLHATLLQRIIAISGAATEGSGRLQLQPVDQTLLSIACGAADEATAHAAAVLAASPVLRLMLPLVDRQLPSPDDRVAATPAPVAAPPAAKGKAKKASSASKNSNSNCSSNSSDSSSSSAAYSRLCFITAHALHAAAVAASQRAAALSGQAEGIDGALGGYTSASSPAVAPWCTQAAPLVADVLALWHAGYGDVL